MHLLPKLVAASLLMLSGGGCSEDSARQPGKTTPNGGGGGGGTAAGGGPLGGAGGLGGQGEGGGGGAKPLALTYYDINHILSTGQSLSVGAVGSPALSLSQPYDNVMFSGGVAATTALTSFAPLIEGVAPIEETMSSSFANHVTQMARGGVLRQQPSGERTHDILVSLHGVNGTAYAGLEKGTLPYANGMAQLVGARAVCAAQSLTHVVRAVTTVHGETDHVIRNTNYEANLVAWQQNYESDIQAITQQAESIPLFQTQMSSWTVFNSSQSAIPSAQLAASENHPNRIILVGPKYNLAYAADGLHLTNDGYRHMGAYYAKAYRQTVLEGRPWQPLKPKSISRVGALITAVFDVPVPPLVLDTIQISDPGNYGFEYVDDSRSTPPITGVAVVGPRTVNITLATPPTGSNGRLRYAFSGVRLAAAGAVTGPRGNLRDSDDSVSPGGHALRNWCVHFDKPLL